MQARDAPALSVYYALDTQEFTTDPAGCAFLQGVASAATFNGGKEAVLPRLLGAPVLDEAAAEGCAARDRGHSCIFTSDASHWICSLTFHCSAA